MASSITFPKTSDGEWTSIETGVKIAKGKNFREVGLYYVLVPVLSESGWMIVGQAKTLNGARDFAKTYAADVVRPLIAKAYIEALGEHIDRTERRAVAAGVSTWSLVAARRVITYTGNGWYAAILNDIRRVDEAIAEELSAVIHHVTRYGNVISCGATGRVRAEETASKVTCEACETADYQRLVDTAHGQAIEDNDEIDRLRREKSCTVKVNSRYPHACGYDPAVASDPEITPGYDTCGMTEDEHAEYTPERVRSAEFRAATYHRAARNALYRAIPMDMSIADRELIDEAHEEAAEMIAAEIDRVYHLTDDSDRPEHERFAGIARLIRQAKRYHLEGRYGKAIMYARTAERMFVVKDGRRRDDAHAEAVACLIS